MNRVYETDATKSYVITSVIGWEAQLLNDWVCKIGIGEGPTFGRACGQITKQDTTIADPDTGHVFPAKRGDFNGTCAFFCDGNGIIGGDSGGPVVYNAGIFGIVSTINGKWTVGRDVEQDLDVWICLNADCTSP